jgi:dipeptidyl aminopeptidase/acylaminoacyl peptidase
MPLSRFIPPGPRSSAGPLHLGRSRRRRAVVGGLLAAAAAGTAGWLARARAPTGAGAAEARVQIDSLPPGAAVEIDGRPRGHAPAGLPVAAGDHRVTVRHEGYAPATYVVTAAAGETATLSAELWLSAPHARRLRPAFPGAAIEAAAFLRDGRVALTMAVPPGEERQLWLVDGRGAPRRAGPPDVLGSLAVAPDGGRVAYLARGPAAGGAGGAGATEVWIAGPEGGRGEHRFVLPDGAAERLVDLSWAPDGGHLLLVGRQPLAGGHRTRLRRLDVDGGEQHELASLPGEVVPGAYAWSPTADRLALVARAGQVASLCLLDTAGGAFRYLTDLDGDAPPPFPPVAWSPDGGRLLYAAPAQDRPAPGGWPFGFGARPLPALFATDATGPLTRQVGEGVGHFPAWRPDGGTVALARGKDGALVLRAVDPGGGARDVAQLPLRAAGAFAARWDVAHAQAVVVLAGSGAFAAGLAAGQPEHWLVRLRPEEAP